MKTNNRIIGYLLLVFIVLLAFTPNYVFSATSSDDWIKTYGGSGDEEGYFIEMVDNGYIFAGITNSSGFGQYDFLLIKTDSSGNLEWNQTYGGLHNDIAYSLVTTPDGGYALAGSTSSFGAGSADFWLVKVDSMGNIEWNQTYGSQNYDSCRSLVTTIDGGYALLGYSTPFISEDDSSRFRLGNSDVWLVKVDSSGNLEWNKTYGGSGSDSVSTIIETADRGFVLGCSTSSFGAGGADFWLVKVDSIGNLEWNQTYGGSGFEFANSLALASDGGYTLAGSTSSFGEGSVDVWLVKVDSSGNLEWNMTYGGLMADYCDSVVISSDGGYAMACITQPPTFGDGNFWLIKTNSVGELISNQTYGVSAHHSHASLLTTANEDYIFGGSTRDKFGHRDFLLVKIDETNTETEILLLISITIGVVVIIVATVVYYRKILKKRS